MTLVEVLTVVTIIGILSGAAILGYSHVRESAEETVALDNVATLNHALEHFNQANWDIVLTPGPGETADELAVLHTLKWRDPTNPTPGSPYLAANFSESVSTSSSDYRIQWNGYSFELLEPGTAGAGLKTGFDSSGGATTYSFPDNYQPIGPGQQ
ncbi:MAG: type II secretion system protein [Chthoniobacterales bacterium]